MHHDPKRCAHCLDLQREEMSDDDPAVRVAALIANPPLVPEVTDWTNEELIGLIMAREFHPLVPRKR